MADDRLFETSLDPELIAAYVRADRTLDDLPYTDAFEALFSEVVVGDNPMTRAEVFHRLHNLRKAGKLPRLGKAASSPPKLEPDLETMLVACVEAEVGELSKRDRLLFTPAFDRVVTEFNGQTGLYLSPHDVWRVVAKLAKRAKAEASAPTQATIYDYRRSGYGSVSEALIEEARQHNRESLTKVLHCLEQLDEQQVWARNHPSLNAIGNLVLHLCGNLTQWVTHGIPALPDARDRQAEFDEKGPIPKTELAQRLRSVVEQADAVLADLDDETLLLPRTVQGFETLVVTIVMHTTTHFEGHAQEIIRLTRELRGPAYTFLWSPE